MAAQFPFEIQPQPDSRTCGPTCLHAVYHYYGDAIGLDRVVREVPAQPEGGTHAVFLACHALRRGYHATIYTYNLQVFDPTWFVPAGVDLRAKLAAQREHKQKSRLQAATRGYLDFLELGGRVRLEDLTTQLVRKYLVRKIPILTGLSATFLYRQAREFGPQDQVDDVRGVPQGHFVVLCGYDRATREVLVADPYWPNPFDERPIYPICIDRVLNAILLGTITYDANLLILEPQPGGVAKGGS